MDLDKVFLDDGEKNKNDTTDSTLSTLSTTSSVSTVASSGSIKKKKPGKVVQSRYLQVSNSSVPKQGSAKKERSTSATRSTPQHAKGGNKLVSTPTGDTQTIPPLNHDASAIAPVSVTEPKILVNLGPRMTTTCKKGRTISRTKAAGRKQEPLVALPQNDDVPVEEPQVKKETKQLDLEMEYCRYLQSVYLNKMSQKAFRKLTDDTEKQMFNLWKQVEDHWTEILKLESHIEAVKSLVQQHHAYEIQKNALDVLIGTTGTTRKLYQNIASALDKTRHQLPVTGISVPQDKDSLSEMEKVLNETQSLLQQIEDATIDQRGPVGAIADNMNRIEENLTQEMSIWDNCRTVLTRIESLLICESSLKLSLEQVRDSLKHIDSFAINSDCSNRDCAEKQKV